MRATAYGHAELVKLLLEYEGGMQDNCGYTALMLAAKVAMQIVPSFC